MSVGTSIPLPAYTLDPAFMARTAESLGFESIWYAEHPVLPVQSASQFPSGGEIPWTYAHFADPYIALARASGATSTIKLGTGITLVPERNPLMLAKEIATLDRISGGKVHVWHRRPAGTGRKPKCSAGISTTAGRRPGRRWR